MFVISKFYKSYESFDDKENQRRLASRKLPELLCRRKCSFCSTIRIMNSNCPFKSLNCTLSKVIIAGLLFIVLIWVGVVKSVDGPKSSVLKVTDKAQVSFFVDNSSFSADEKARSVQTECAKLIGVCEDDAFVFKVNILLNPFIWSVKFD